MAMRSILALGLAALLAAQPVTLRAQTSPEVAATAEPVPLSEAELDTLVAPVALFPDALLAQVLVAATYPLDIMRADRWATRNAALEGTAREEAATAQGWDPSVAVLAAGFPTVLARMAEDIDGTEALGDALIADPDGVLDAVQRQRARAAALGNLQSNAAQTVVEEAGAITIAPADPKVIYVPSYDPVSTFTTPVTAAPVIVTDSASTGHSTGTLITTGLLAFGAGLIVAEIFDDDDNWGGYWGRPPIGWGTGSLYPRPGWNNVTINGDVNISRDRERSRDNAWRPEPRQVQQARDRIAARPGQPSTPGLRPGTQRPVTLPADAGSRDRAREAISARRDTAAAAPGAQRPAVRPETGSQRPATRPAAVAARPANRGEAFNGLRDGRADTNRAVNRGTASAAAGERIRKTAPADRAQRPAAARPAAGARGEGARASAFDRKPDRGGARAGAAAQRGERSGKGLRDGGGRGR